VINLNRTKEGKMTRRLYNIADILESGMSVRVKTRANSGNDFRTKRAKVLSVAGGAARLRVEGEEHPRTVRLNMIELDINSLQVPEIKTSIGDKLPEHLRYAANRHAAEAQVVPLPEPPPRHSGSKQQQRPQQQPQPRQQPQQPQQPQQLKLPTPLAVEAPHKQSGLETAGGSVWIIAELTPQVAEKMLANQHPNQRKLREIHVLTIANDMEKGTYKWTGDPIRFDLKGRLIDGQHRLSAVVLSGATLRDVVAVRVNDDEVSAYIDTNARPRSLHDIRKFNGQRSLSGPVIAGIIMDACDFKPHSRDILSKAEQNSIIEGCQYVDELQHFHNISRVLRLTAPHHASILRCLRANREAACIFFEAVCRNEHSINDEYQPMVKLLVDWLGRHRELRTGKVRNNGALLENKAVASKMIRAYNAWREGAVLAKLQAGDSIPEALT
jgi:hypothetical protein